MPSQKPSKSLLSYLNPLKPLKDIKETLSNEATLTKKKYQSTISIIKDISTQAKEQQTDKIDELLNEEDGHVQFMETMQVEGWDDDRYFKMLNKQYKTSLITTIICGTALLYLLWISMTSNVFGFLYLIIFTGILSIYYLSVLKRYAELKEQTFYHWGEFLLQPHLFYPSKFRHNSFVSMKDFEKWYQEHKKKEKIVKDIE